MIRTSMEHSSSDPRSATPQLVHMEGTRPLSPNLFYNLGLYVIVFIHACFEHVTNLPYPFGQIIKVLEGKVKPWLHPLFDALEEQFLCLLAFLDNQVFGLCSVFEQYSTTLLAALSRMQELQWIFEQAFKTAPIAIDRRRLIGLSAGLWIRYEEVVEKCTQRAVDLTSVIPLLNVITLLFCAVAALLVNSVSEWLVKHSDLEAKSMQSPYRESWASGEGVEKSYTRATQPTPWKDRITNMVEGIEEFKEGKTVEQGDEPSDSGTEVATPEALLEMIDSGWLLGSTAVSPKKRSGSRSFRFGGRSLDHG